MLEINTHQTKTLCRRGTFHLSHYECYRRMNIHHSSRQGKPTWQHEYGMQRYAALTCLHGGHLSDTHFSSLIKQWHVWQKLFLVSAPGCKKRPNITGVISVYVINVLEIQMQTVYYSCIMYCSWPHKPIIITFIAKTIHLCTCYFI